MTECVEHMTARETQHPSSRERLAAKWRISQCGLAGGCPRLGYRGAGIPVENILLQLGTPQHQDVQRLVVASSGPANIRSTTPTQIQRGRDDNTHPSKCLYSAPSVSKPAPIRKHRDLRSADTFGVGDQPLTFW